MYGVGLGKSLLCVCCLVCLGVTIAAVSSFGQIIWVCCLVVVCLLFGVVFLIDLF